MPDGDLSCPQCGRTARMQKLSAIVAAGSSTTTSRTATVGIGYGGRSAASWTSQSHSKAKSQTELSARLSPPPRPPSPYGGIVVQAFLVTLITIAGVGAATQSAGWAVIAAVPVAAVALYSLVPAWETRPLRLDAWQRQMQQWDALFYCGRCDVVFRPEDRCFVAASDWQPTFLADVPPDVGVLCQETPPPLPDANTVDIPQPSSSPVVSPPIYLRRRPTVARTRRR